jgi:hypothetical protein
VRAGLGRTSEKGIQGIGHPSSPYGLRRDKEDRGQGFVNSLNREFVKSLKSLK